MEFQIFSFLSNLVVKMLFRVLGIFLILPSILLVLAAPATFDLDHAEELEHEFQGDMIISQADLDAFNGRIDTNLRWPNNIVPYYIDPTLFSKLNGNFYNLRLI